MTDARVDYKGRLHITVKSHDKEYTTVVCEYLKFDIGRVSDILEDRGMKFKGHTTSRGELLFDVKSVTVSNRRPKKRR